MVWVLDADLPVLNFVSTARSLAPDVRFLRGQPLRFFFPGLLYRGSAGSTPLSETPGAALSFFFSFSFLIAV